MIIMLRHTLHSTLLLYTTLHYNTLLTGCAAGALAAAASGVLPDTEKALLRDLTEVKSGADIVCSCVQCQRRRRRRRRTHL
jgi:hypothetical protein